MKHLRFALVLWVFALTAVPAQAARICDGQCALIVADAKCKHLRSNVENLSCITRNGATQDDTPALCAQARSLSGCVMKADAGSGNRARSSGLSPQQIAACTMDIHNKQRESQRWGGDVNDISNRLGRYQKELFEGRCAGHPEAAAYLRGANTMLGYKREASAASGNNNQSNRLKPIRRDTQSTEHNPIHNASSCIKIYGPAEMKARGMHGVLPSTMENTCPYSVSVKWCVASENGRSGDCRPGYSNLVNLSGAGQKGSNRYGVSAVNQTVHFAACRYGKNMGFQRVEMDPRHPFRFSCS